MKTLLGLLLVMRMVGCGDPPPAQAADANTVAALEKLKADIERNWKGEVVDVNLSIIGRSPMQSWCTSRG